jgi:hypothetical protein
MALDTKVNVNENGLEDMDDFWNTAKTPKAVEPKNKPKKRKPLKQDNRKSIQKTVKRAPRFSLDGNTEGESVGGDMADFRLKLEKGALSPGDLSHVTTAPPTPKPPEQSREQSPVRSPENARAYILEDDNVMLANKHVAKSPLDKVDTMPISPSAPDDDFQMDDDGDDADDLLPPPPPEDLQPEEENLSSRVNDVEFPDGGDFEDSNSVTSSRSVAKVQEEAPGASNENKTVIVDDENDEDNDGHGFEMNSPAISTSTDPSAVVAKKKRGRPRKNESFETTKTPVVQKGRKKQRHATLFSPPGYPVGNREMNPVPVSDYKESPEQGKRRSRRMHVKPLAYWKNERVVYGPHDEDGELGDEMGCMPVPMSVLTALPTPRKQRKPVALAGAAKKGRSSQQSGVVEDEKPFDDSRLRKKYKFVDGEYAQIWDESLEASTDDSKWNVEKYGLWFLLLVLFGSVFNLYLELFSQRLSHMLRISLKLNCHYQRLGERSLKARS